MFLTAGPGCGKSVLARYLVDDFFGARSDICCYYFFPSAGKGAGDKVVMALGAILHQLCLKVAPQALPVIMEFWNDFPAQILINQSLMWQLLVRLAKRLDRRINCLIDGLDEAHEEGRAELLQMINGYFVAPGDAKLNFIISARPYMNMEYRFQLLTNNLREAEFDIGTHPIGDEIQQILKAKVETFPLSSASKSYLLDGLLRRQQVHLSRSLLWVHTITDHLSYNMKYQNAGQEAIDELLRSIPRDVEHAYENLLERSDDPGSARRLLHIILGAVEPLTLQALQTAFLMSQSSLTGHDVSHLYGGAVIEEMNADFWRKVRSICGLFVNLMHDKVYLFHHTAREFLETEPQNPCAVQGWKHSFMYADSHILMRKACFNYFRHWHSTGYQTLIRDVTDFHQYAFKRWYGHHLFAMSLNQDLIPPAAETRSQKQLDNFEELFPLYGDQLLFLDASKDCFWEWTSMHLEGSYPEFSQLVMMWSDMVRHLNFIISDDMVDLCPALSRERKNCQRCSYFQCIHRPMLHCADKHLVKLKAFDRLKARAPKSLFSENELHEPEAFFGALMRVCEANLQPLTQAQSQQSRAWHQKSAFDHVSADEMESLANPPLLESDLMMLTR